MWNTFDLYPTTNNISSSVSFSFQLTKQQNSMKKILHQSKVTVALLFFLLFYSVVQAVTITSTAIGGAWSTKSTWVGGVVPANGDAVVIATTGAGVVQITAGFTQNTAGSVTVNSGATLSTNFKKGTITFGSLTINSGGTAIIYNELTVLGVTSIAGTINFGSTSNRTQGMSFTGAVILVSGATWVEPATGNGANNTYSFSNNFTNNASIFNAVGTGTHTFSGTGMNISGTTPTAIPNVSITGTRTNSGTLTVSTGLANNGTLTNSSTGILNYGGTGAIEPTLNAAAPGNTVNYVGASQTAKVTAYHNLILSGLGAKTFLTTPTVNGILSLEGTASVIVTTGVVTYGTAATLQYNKTAAYTATTEEWISPFISTGGIIIANTGTVTVPATRTIANGSSLNLQNGTLIAGTNISMASTSTINRSEGSMAGTPQGMGIYNVNYTGSSKISGPELGGSGLKDLTINLNDVANALTSSVSALIVSGTLVISKGKFIIDPLKSVTVNGTLTLNDSIILKSSSAGTASLMTKGSITGSKARVERYINGASWAWHFLSSPVAAQAISGGFTPIPATSYDFYTWYEPQLTWVNFKNTAIAPTWNTANGNTNFVPGQGYLVAYEATNTTKNFKGAPNNGAVSYSLTKSGASTYQYFNLVGNPYPCSINWDAASGWDRSKLNGIQKSFWIWNDAAGNYGAYISGSGGYGTNGVTNYISNGQGFMVLASAAGAFTMNDNIKANSSQSLLKSGNVISEALRLKLNCDANSYSDEALFSFNNSVDGGSQKFNSMYTESPELWSVKNGENYSINFMSEMNMEKIIPLAVKAGVTGTYTITSSQLESFSSNLAISLEDRATGTFTSLRTTPAYTFRVNTPATIADRFFLHFIDAVGIADSDVASKFNIYTTDGIINIQSLQPLGGKIAVIDMLGRTVATGRVEAGTTSSIDMRGNTGVYILCMLTSEGVCNTKILVK